MLLFDEYSAMKHYGSIVTFALAAFLLAPAAVFGEKPPVPGAILVVQGKVLDSAGMPLSDASVLPYLDGKLYMPSVKKADLIKVYSTGRNGLFMFQIAASPGKIQNGQWSLKVTRPSFRPSQAIPLKLLDEGKGETGIQRLVATASVKLARYRGTPFLIALIVFIGVYVMIAFEIVHRTMAALLGAVTLLVITHTFGHFNDAYKVLTYDQALQAVDWNVIFLLMGMMIIVGVLKVSGVFQWLAYKSFQVAGGRIFVLASALCLVTAVIERVSRQCHYHVVVDICDDGIGTGLGDFPICVSCSRDSRVELRWCGHPNWGSAQHYDRFFRGLDIQ